MTIIIVFEALSNDYGHILYYVRKLMIYSLADKIDRPLFS